MKLVLNIAGKDTCTIEVFEDRFPVIAEGLRKVLPVTSIAQHGKIVGDLLYISLPLMMPLENAEPLQDICARRREETGGAGGAVCFYGPRQQICIYYGDDVANEPFELSCIGEVTEGLKDLQLAAIGCWVSPGEVATLRMS